MECSDNPAGDIILNGEQVRELSVEMIRPHPDRCPRFDKLSGNANFVSRPPNASFQDIADAEFSPDVVNIDRFRLVGERRAPGDYEKIAGLGQQRSDVLRHAICKIFLLGISAEILERQHGNRGFVRKGKGRLRRLNRAFNDCRFNWPPDFPNGSDEPKSLAQQGFDQALLLAGISDRAPGDIQTGCQRGIRHAAPVPDGVDQVVLADNPLPVADQVVQKVEHLRRDRDHVGPAPQFAPVGVECVLLEEVAQAANSLDGLCRRLGKARISCRSGKCKPDIMREPQGLGILTWMERHDRGRHQC